MVSRRKRAQSSINSQIVSLSGQVADQSKSAGGATVAAGDIQTDAVDQNALASDSVGTDQIIPGAVGTNELGIVNEIKTDSYVVLTGSNYPAAAPGATVPLSMDENKRLVQTTLPTATTTTPGIVELATDIQTAALSDATLAVTPHGLLAALLLSNRQNKIINGNFEINQRGYVSAGSLFPGVFGFDRWCGGGYTNLILNPTGAATTAQTNWTTDAAGNGSIAGVAATIGSLQNQSKAVRSTMAASSTGGFVLNGSASGGGAGTSLTIGGLPQVRHGIIYTFAIWVNPSVAKTINLSVQPVDELGNLVGSAITSTGVACGAGSFTQLTLAFTVPNGASRVTVSGLVSVAWTAGQTLTYGAAQLIKCPATALPTYFDGASTGSSWSGTANASPSYNVSAAATLTFTADPHGQTVTLSSGATVQTYIERANIAAGTWTIAHDGTAGIRAYNVGTAPGSLPAFASSPITFTATGLDDVIVELQASGGTKTIINVRMFQGSVDWGFVLPDVGATLSLCLRYFQIFKAGDVHIKNPYTGVALGTGSQICDLPMQPMRIPPLPKLSNNTFSGVQVITYLSSSAGASSNLNVRFTTSTNLGLTPYYLAADNSGGTLAAVYSTGINLNVIWLDAEL